ncbi:MAG: hypothetical protein QM529_04235 [Hydrotalea sp.]|nr:hypothetical protein [Hydrotalea sp.]
MTNKNTTITVSHNNVAVTARPGGAHLSSQNKKIIEYGMERMFREYSNCLKKLAKE